MGGNPIVGDSFVILEQFPHALKLPWRIARIETMTPKQERYAQALASGTMSQSDAYRRAGYGGKSSPSTINNDSHKLAQHPDIIARVSALRADMMATATYDASMLLADFQRVARVAVEKEQLTAAVSALTAIGKIIGAFPPTAQRELLVRHSGRGAVQDSPTPTTMTAERARGILGVERARVETAQAKNPAQ